MDGEFRVSIDRTQSKKRGLLEEVEDTFEHKRVKMRDLESVFRSEARGSQRKKTVAQEVEYGSKMLDLNVDVDPIDNTVDDNPATCIEESHKFHPSLHGAMERDDVPTKCRGFDLDLNAEAVSISIDDPFYPYKRIDDLKSRDDSECGSSVGPLDEKDSVRVCKRPRERGQPIRIPKPRAKKNDIGGMKRKMELAKKEQVDRFARFAAPSGLLNELNPGIINNVRNSKQVYRIIEALVRSDTNENLHSGSKENDQTRSYSKEDGDIKEQENVHSSEVNGRNACTFFSESIDLTMKNLRGDGVPYRGVGRSTPMMASQCNTENENDGLDLKLSSSPTAAVENGCYLPNEESEKFTSLSLEAANVASKWLELLSQDIRGRLSALRRSKKRVGAVIATEFTFLNSRELSSDLEKENVQEHFIKWSTLFGQMHKKLSEEESQLESWFNQVKEMQLNCERGLYKSSLHHALQLTGSVTKGGRSGEVDDNMENNLAAMASAASIFSTCNFLSSM